MAVLLTVLAVWPSGRLAAQSAAQSYEQRLIAIPDTASVRAMSRDLSAVPHVAGTPAQAVTRDYVLDRMRRWGLDVWTKEYTVYLPHPDTVGAWVITGARAVPLPLAEPPIVAPNRRGPPISPGPQVAAFNGYSGNGDVTADVVYVNYGLIDDYRMLDSMGISVRGRVVLARYGRSFRGIKAREAEKRGAVGLIVYSDPQDDGYFRGDVYPRGPMRPARGVQRGSMMNSNGDPTTPGWASVAGARRVAEDSLPLARIPIIPMAYGNARRFLQTLGGPSVPQAWQGGLPFRYHTGPGPVRARLKVKMERGARAFHEIWNTFGI
ncbi:MAG: PA domain-containing protein, partial [Gemmatimonadales bacterium]